MECFHYLAFSRNNYLALGFFQFSLGIRNYRHTRLQSVEFKNLIGYKHFMCIQVVGVSSQLCLT